MKTGEERVAQFTDAPLTHNDGQLRHWKQASNSTQPPTARQETWAGGCVHLRLAAWVLAVSAASCAMRIASAALHRRMSLCPSHSPARARTW
jgi:hypothetical protein